MGKSKGKRGGQLVNLFVFEAHRRARPRTTCTCGRAAQCSLEWLWAKIAVTCGVSLFSRQVLLARDKTCTRKVEIDWQTAAYDSRNAICRLHQILDQLHRLHQLHQTVLEPLVSSPRVESRRSFRAAAGAKQRHKATLVE